MAKSSPEYPDSFSFQCSACGKCCNSVPQLSIPELFRHQEVFVGSLAIRRVRRLEPGMRLVFGPLTYCVDDAQSRSYAELANTLLYRPDPHAQGRATFDYLITTQGFDYESRGHCPALADLRCSLQERGKPLACTTVPLDPFFPDNVQHIVLASHMASGRTWLQNCIVEGSREGFLQLTQSFQVTDTNFRTALEQRRKEIALDKQLWGNDVFEMLRRELFSETSTAPPVPTEGFMSLALVPVLMLLGQATERCRQRCTEYIKAQLLLMNRMVKSALKRSKTEDGPTTRQLAAWIESYEILHKALQDENVSSQMQGPNSADRDRQLQLETWIGLSSGFHPAPPPVEAESLSGYSENSPELAEAAVRMGISEEAVETYIAAGRSEHRSGVTRSFHAVMKPVGAACNLKCDYCYYRSKKALLSHGRGPVSDHLLENFIADYIGSQDAPEIQFTWHGGEPTLLGLDFFRKVVALQAKYTTPGRRITNDLQTNGTLLDDTWCSFLRDNDFLVGLSVDGPRNLHDLYRLNHDGSSSFEAVLAASARLRQHGVPFATLTTVHRKNAVAGGEVYRFLRDQIGSTYMQFTPCVESRNFENFAPGANRSAQGSPIDSKSRSEHPASIVTSWSVDPYEWGDFLCAVFDEWTKGDVGRINVNLFETFRAQLAGRPSMICSTSSFCGKNLAVEHDGRVYSCDHFVYPDYEIGTVGQQSLAKTIFSLKQLEFGLNKFNTLPRECRECEYLKLCGGDCPRTRLVPASEGDENISYLCPGWKKFFYHFLLMVPWISAFRG